MRTERRLTHEGRSALTLLASKWRDAVVELLDMSLQQPVLGKHPCTVAVLAAKARVYACMDCLGVALQTRLLAKVGTAAITLERPLLLAGV